jgi:hypothetical protein
MVTAMWFAVPKPKGGGYRLLQPEEAAAVRGGKTQVSSSSSSSLVNIPLYNVPYITQHLNPNNKSNTSQQITRSTKYCGIASALMVRAKRHQGNYASPYSYFLGDYNDSTTDSAMREIDNNLLKGNYGYVYNNRKVDVLANQGLLYIMSGAMDNDIDWGIQYNTTVDILQGVYTGKLGDPKYSFSDYIPMDNHHVSGVSMRPVSATLKSGTANISDATKAIWDHINNYHQPVVAVVDSNKQVFDQVVTSTMKPTLHYIVIRGIYNNASGTRYFYVYDPYVYMRDLKYSESDLRKLIAMPANASAWVYKYGNYKVGSDPAYVLTVQGD